MIDECEETQRPWWEALTLCAGKRKDGKPCNKKRRLAYERQPSDLVIPFNCWQHINQEESKKVKFL